MDGEEGLRPLCTGALMVDGQTMRVTLLVNGTPLKEFTILRFSSRAAVLTVLYSVRDQFSQLRVLCRFVLPGWG